MAYARVVEALHRVETVLPLRYGGMLDTARQARELLCARRAELLASLAKVEGCVEMGLRILLGEPTRPAEAAPVPSTARAYLASRRALYADRDGARADSGELIGRIQEALEGLFVQSRLEQSPAGDRRVLSLYFLVRREREAEFRKAFQGLHGKCSARLLLSGPWPPYNFAGVVNSVDSIETLGELASRGLARRETLRGRGATSSDGAACWRENEDFGA
jgi:hypothetical protein